jgi:hypothetical protein
MGPFPSGAHKSGVWGMAPPRYPSCPVPRGIAGPPCLRGLWIQRPSPPGWGLSVGLTTPHHKRTTVLEPQRGGQGQVWAVAPLDGRRWGHLYILQNSDIHSFNLSIFKLSCCYHYNFINWLISLPWIKCNTRKVWRPCWDLPYRHLTLTWDIIL